MQVMSCMVIGFVLSTTGNDMGVVIGHRSPGP